MWKLTLFSTVSALEQPHFIQPMGMFRKITSVPNIKPKCECKVQSIKYARRNGVTLAYFACFIVVGLPLKPREGTGVSVRNCPRQ